jgi:FKBP-type peptidyl-prolyl cis-trans isomerase FklB
MKLRWIVALTIPFLAGLACAEEKAPPKTQKDKVSYSIGLDIGKNLKEQSVEVNPDYLAKGLKDSLSGEKSLLTDEEIREAMTAFQAEMQAKQEARMKDQGEKNKIEGEAFLAENKKKQGVVTLPSGLQYKVVKQGAGKSPKPTDTVTTHYRGTLIDGTEFDSSYKRNEPVSFPVNGVIKGWTEALQLMKAGSKWELYIPSNLAYGEQGAGNVIGPNATLIFEVELISVK